MLTTQRKKRKLRIRAKISGTAVAPRLAVYRSNKYIYAQIIDDTKHHTLVGLPGSLDAAALGKKLADLAKKKKITKVVFDRAGYSYHGRIKALADAAREGGLKF
jgi:large subunit ribosomal protein L18